MLKNERACLLTGWDESGATAKVVYPEHNEALVEVPPGTRILAVTRKDLRLEVNAGRFPAKLLHRIGAVRLRAPDVVLS